MKTQINLLGAPRDVEITRKKMRSIRLRVTDAGEIKLSAPRLTTQAQLDRFLGDHRPWLENALRRLDAKAPTMDSERIADGAQIRLHGAAYTIRIEPAARIGIRADHAARTIVIRTAKTDEPYLTTRFAEWWRTECHALYGLLCARYLPLFAVHGVRMPQLTVRKMTSRWGSCNAAKGHVTLNYFLLRAPMACIEYVVLHELTHMINQTHNSAFYEFIARAMPDWKARRNLLKNERIC